MKNLKTVQTTSSIVKRYSGVYNGQMYEAVIRLNDECGNGHEDFSITGTIYQKGATNRTERNEEISGAIGDYLSKINKNFALIEKLHLCDFNGVPMHAIANMFYHLKNGFERLKGMTQREYFCDYYRITLEQYDKLAEAKEQDHFTALFISMPEILANWKFQAQKAIEFLESETGLKFESKATRSHLILPDDEKINLLIKRMKGGYYK